MPKKIFTPDAEFDFFKNARDIAFVLAVYLYFAGWVYIYTYFNSFGLSIRQADLEFYYFLVYSVNVLSYLIFSHWLLTAMAIALSMAAIHFLKQGWVTYVICVLLFGMLYYSAVLSGRADANRDFSYQDSKLLRIKFVLKEETEGLKKDTITEKAGFKKDTLTAKAVAKNIAAPSGFPPEDIGAKFKEYNQNERLRLLLTTKEEYLVILINASVTQENALSKDKIIYTIKKDKVELVRVIK